MARKRRIEVEDIGGICNVRLVDQSMAGAEEIESERPVKLLTQDDINHTADDIRSLIDELGKKHIILDLRHVERVSSAFFSKLVWLSRKAEARQGQLVLCHVPPDMQQGLHACGYTKWLAIYPNEQAAMQALSLPETCAHAAGITGPRAEGTKDILGY